MKMLLLFTHNAFLKTSSLIVFHAKQKDVGLISGNTHSDTEVAFDKMICHMRKFKNRDQMHYYVSILSSSVFNRKSCQIVTEFPFLGKL